ncbi:MAG TPA: glycosyltransferase family 4 protein [Pirellulales bacterium]|nr:glycosyltransferase family 4 protein [Pirellulales bacterium]
MQESVTLRQELGLPAAAPIVLHVGRFTWEKNHLGLLAIFQEVLKSVPQARMLLVGAGPLQSKVKNAIIECGLENNAILLGMRNDVPRLMRCCQVLLHPSFFEGLPVTVLEAMSAGLPVVASDIPGIRAEVIESGHSGFLHSVNEPLAMAQSISQLLLNPALAAKIGQTGRTIVENHFSLAATANRYITLYENCMLQKPDIIPTSMPTRHSSRTIDAGRQSLKSF